MKGKLISEDAQRTFAVILNTDDEAVGCLTAFAKEHRLSASQFTGLGAFRDCVLGYFDWQKKDDTRSTGRRRTTRAFRSRSKSRCSRWSATSH
jgi:predicted DNA-binding protein with PD1-like motif